MHIDSGEPTAGKYNSDRQDRQPEDDQKEPKPKPAFRRARRVRVLFVHGWQNLIKAPIAREPKPPIETARHFVEAQRSS
jgi:hypothetical protein